MRIRFDGHDYHISPDAMTAFLGAQAAYQGRIIEGARALFGERQYQIFRQHHTLGDLERFVGMVRALQSKRR